MSKSTTRILILIALVCRILGDLLVPAPHTPFSYTREIRDFSSLILLLAWLILFFTGVIGALVKMARLKQWRWFVALCFVLPVFVYIFWGPTDSAPLASTMTPKLP